MMEEADLEMSFTHDMKHFYLYDNFLLHCTTLSFWLKYLFSL